MIKLPETPCDSCMFCVEKQVEQFLYNLECKNNAPAEVFWSKWGCWMWMPRTDPGEE